MIGIFALLLAATAVQKEAPPTPALQARIKRYFDADLLDGASARWKWPTHNFPNGLYCGWVNAKNRIGAFTGWQGFYVLIGDKGEIIKGGIAVDESAAGWYADMCSQAKGYDITSPPRD
jgi:hypothetical protein